MPARRPSGCVVTELARSDFLADAEAFAEVAAARDADRADVLVRRRLDLLHAAMLPNQVPEERGGGSSSSRSPSRAATRSTVASSAASPSTTTRSCGSCARATIRSSVARRGRRRRRSARWSDDVRELARLRNEAARSLGYRDWFALSLETSELDETRLFATLHEVDAATAEPFARWKAELDATLAERFTVAPAELRPWHYDDPFFQELPIDGGVDLDPLLGDRDPVEVSRRTFDGIGPWADPRAQRPLSPGGEVTARVLHRHRPRGDVRVLANVESNCYWTDTMLHELGHGVYDVGIDGSLPWLLRTPHLIATEGVAMLFGRLARDSEWLARVAEVDAQSSLR